MRIRRKLAIAAAAGGMLVAGVATAAPASALGQTDCSNPSIVLWSGSTPFCYGGADGGVAVAVYGVGGINFNWWKSYNVLTSYGWTGTILGPSDLTPSRPITIHEMWQGPR